MTHYHLLTAWNVCKIENHAYQGKGFSFFFDSIRRLAQLLCICIFLIPTYLSQLFQLFPCLLYQSTVFLSCHFTLDTIPYLSIHIITRIHLQNPLIKSTLPQTLFPTSPHGILPPTRLNSNPQILPSSPLQTFHLPLYYTKYQCPTPVSISPIPQRHTTCPSRHPSKLG